MNQVRHLKVKQLIDERCSEMESNIRQTPRVYAKETIWGVFVVVLLWMAFMSDQMWQFVNVIANV